MAQEDTAGRRAREEAVYRHHAPQVLAYLLRHMTSHQDAEDLLVEVFLVVLEKPQLLEIDERRLAAYMQTVARNKMVDYYRKRGRRQIGNNPALLHAATAHRQQNDRGQPDRSG